MRIILGSILAIVLVVVIAIVAIPLLVSTEWIRDQVVAAVNDKTGRTLEISGDTSLSVFPELSLTVGHVAFSNPEGRDGDLIRMDELDVGLKLLPLMSGAVEVDRLILDRPVFALEIAEDGQPNWNIAGGPPGDRRPPQGRRPEGPPREPGGNPLAGIEAIELGDVRIVGGTFSFADQRTGSYQEVSDINATLELPSLTQPLKLSGTLVWLGEAVSFATELAEPQALTTGTPTGFSLSLDSPQLKTALAGTLAVKDGFVIDGTLDLSTPSVRDAGRWLGASVPSVAGLGPFSVRSGVKADETGIALEEAALTLDDITAEGAVLVATGGDMPLVRATLAASRINLDNYLGGSAAGSANAGSGGGGGGSSGSQAGSAGGGWSDEPIDLAGLRQIDADVRVSAAGLSVSGIEIGQSALAVTLKDALLSVDLSELQLYDGRAAGKLTINAAGETPAVAAAFNIDSIAARPLLAAATGIDWLEGRGRIRGSLASRGASQRALVGALTGETAFAFTDGSIRGINVARMVRNLQAGNIAGWNDGEAQQTDFSELSASFAITRGIAQTNDIQLLSPLVRLTGAGVADLPNRTVDFRINPKIVASLEGQGGTGALAGLEIPILIRGPWSNPQIAPDAEALLKDPSKTIDAVGGVVKELTGQDVGGALKEAVRDPGQLLNQLTGGGQGGGQPAPMAEDVFKQLLGQ